MRKLIILAIISTSFQSCLTVVQLQGKYRDNPLAGKFNTSYDNVWQATIQTITEMNLPVNITDKESGMISSYQGSYMDRITYEFKGELINPNQYVVTHRPNNGTPRFYKQTPSLRLTPYFPFETLTGRFKIFVRSTSENEVTVSVILSGFEYIESKPYQSIRHYPEIYTTRSFEKEVLDRISDTLAK